MMLLAKPAGEGHEDGVEAFEEDEGWADICWGRRDARIERSRIGSIKGVNAMLTRWGYQTQKLVSKQN